MPGEAGVPELLGEIAVDSGAVALVDAGVREQFWRQEGQARIGVVSTPQHRTIAELLRQRFGLQSKPVSRFRSDLTRPVSHDVEEEIIAYLKTLPEYAEYPFMYFRVETRNTCDQLHEGLDGQRLWCELVLDKASGGNVLAFSSGFGDGCYSAYGVRGGGRWSRAVVQFIGPRQEKLLEAFPVLRY